MGPISDDPMPKEGTTLNFGSWVYVADGSGGFTSHLTTPVAPGANTTVHNVNSDKVAEVDNYRFSI